jgi:hypothetical protein
VLKSEGDTAIIRTENGNEFVGELLSLQDSSVYMATRQQRAEVVRVVLKNIKYIKIEGYTNRGWVTPVVLFEAIPTVLLTIAAGKVNSDIGGALLIFGLPTLLTYIAFEASTPAPPHMERPMAIENLEQFRKYARFPQGLTPTEFERLLQLYKQNEVKLIK